MKTNRIKITFHDGKYKYIQATNKKLINEKNVVKYVFNRYTNIKKIETLREGHNGHKYKELNYFTRFEQWKDRRARIEATNPKGWEDFTGYGSRTNGLKNRFYLGKSTGFIPIYLEILKNNSYGGGALSTCNGRRVFREV